MHFKLVRDRDLAAALKKNMTQGPRTAQDLGLIPLTYSTGESARLGYKQLPKAADVNGQCFVGLAESNSVSQAHP